MTTPNTRAELFMPSIMLSGVPSCDIWRDGKHFRRPTIPPGGFTIVDHRHVWVSDMPDPFDSVHVFLSRQSLRELTEELGAPPIEALDCSVESPRDDSTMLYLALALLPALSRPVEVNTLYADYVFQAMRIHLAHTYGGLILPAEHGRGGLQPWQHQRARELLLDDLSVDRSLSELASACGLSVRHFTRAFKATTGLPPHRWLLRRRVDRAMELLTATDYSLSEIAQACGFIDQSHFTRVFRAITGFSPGIWRRQRRA
jgi:AraC-like DNA-binding protein